MKLYMYSINLMIYDHVFISRELDWAYAGKAPRELLPQAVPASSHHWWVLSRWSAVYVWGQRTDEEG